METAAKKVHPIRRNYQVDFLKLVCTILIVICHTNSFADRSNVVFMDKLGAISYSCVHVFFVISGFLMVKKISDNNFDSSAAGKTSFEFVLNKFKKIWMPYAVSTGVALLAYIYIYAYGLQSSSGYRQHKRWYTSL